jgi:hypothetical protein
MKRVFALLMIVLLVAVSGRGLAAPRVAKAGCAGVSHAAETGGSCCEPAGGCECDAAPAQDDAPPAPALPAQGSRALDGMVLASVAVAVSEAVFVEREAMVPARDGALLPAPVRRTILHCSFLI